MNKVTIKVIKGIRYYTTSITKDKKTKIIYGKTKKELKEKYETYLKKVSEEESYNLNKNLKLKIAIEEYKNLKANKIKPTSLFNINMALDNLYKYFGNIYLKDIDTLMLNKYFNELGTSSNTKKTTRLYLNSFFKFYYKNRNIAYNPVEALELPKVKNNSLEKEAKTIEEDKAILEAIRNNSKKNKIPLLIMYYTGARVGEVLATTAKDIDLENRTISINKTWVKYKEDGIWVECPQEPKCKYSNRTIYINDELVELLEEHMKNKKGRLFTMGVQTLNNELKKITSDKSIHVHTLRHMYAGRMYNAGMSLKTLKALLGHSPNSELTLTVYSKLNEATIEEEVRQFLG